MGQHPPRACDAEIAFDPAARSRAAGVVRDRRAKCFAKLYHHEE